MTIYNYRHHNNLMSKDLILNCTNSNEIDNWMLRINGSLIDCCKCESLFQCFFRSCSAPTLQHFTFYFKLVGRNKITCKAILITAIE